MRGKKIKMGDSPVFADVKPDVVSMDDKKDQKDVKPLNITAKWRTRVLFSEPCRSNDWTNIVEKQVAVLRVSFPFLTERQIRGKALKICGIPSIMGNLPRIGNPWNLKKENSKKGRNRRYLKHPFLKKRLYSKKEPDDVREKKNNFCSTRNPSQQIKMEKMSPSSIKSNILEMTFPSSPLSKTSVESGFQLLSTSANKRDISKISSSVINDTEIISSISFETCTERSIIDTNSNFVLPETEDTLTSLHSTKVISEISDIKGSLNVVSPKTGCIEVIPSRDITSIYTEQSISSCNSCNIYQEPKASDIDSDRTASFLSVLSNIENRESDLSKTKSFTEMSKPIQASQDSRKKNYYDGYENKILNTPSIKFPCSKNVSFKRKFSNTCVKRRNKLMSHACSEFDKRSMSKDLVRDGNGYIHTSINDIIPVDVSLKEYFTAPNISFEDIEEIVKEKVNDILTQLHAKYEE